MNKRSLLNLFLFIFLVSAIFIFYNKRRETDTSLYLTSLNADDITLITITKPDNREFVFEKKPGSLWYMTQPFQLKAHQFRINTLLKLLRTPVSKTYDTGSLDLSHYALLKPRAKIKFNDTEILFGKTNPVNNKRYLLVDNKISLILDQTYPLVSAQAASFIGLSLLPNNFNINRIKTPASSIYLDNDGKWTSTEKASLNADQIQVLLSNWRSAKAFAVHKYLKRKDLGKIEISSETKTLIFQITDEEPWIVLALPDLNIEYHIDKSQKNSLYGIFKKVTPDA